MWKSWKLYAAQKNEFLGEVWIQKVKSEVKIVKIIGNLKHKLNTLHFFPRQYVEEVLKFSASG